MINNIFVFQRLGIFRRSENNVRWLARFSEKRRGGGVHFFWVCAVKQTNTIRVLPYKWVLQVFGVKLGAPEICVHIHRKSLEGSEWKGDYGKRVNPSEHSPSRLNA